MTGTGTDPDPDRDRDRLIIHVPVPIADPDTVVPLITGLDRLLRGIRTAVCAGWLSDDSGEPRPYLTAWLDLDCALVLTHLAADHAVLELHLSARPGTNQPATRSDQPCCRTAD